MSHAHQWNAKDYATHSRGQEVLARELLASLELPPHEDVLDIGCGDGRMTAEIARMVPRGRVVGVDLSADMIEHANQNFESANLSFRVADAARLPFHAEFDFVYSSAALHWVQDHNGVLAGIANALRPGGRCLLQMGGRGNVADVIEAFEKAGVRPSGFTYAFHGIEEYRRMLSAAGLVTDSVELLPKDMLHASRAALTGWLRTAWHPYHCHVPESEKSAFLETVTDRFGETHPPDGGGAFHVRTVRLEVRARKPWRAPLAAH